MFRQALLLSGGVEPSDQQVEVLLNSALEACECYFQAFQFVVWSGVPAREALVGRQVAAVVNFPPRQIGKFMSEVLTLGFPDGDGAVVLVVPDKAVPNGGKLF
jgi:tRNA-binding EMAP/Myf-like protein